jgi:hypothetical protein
MHRNPALQVAQVYDRSAATAASFVVSFVMAWSPFLRANAGIIGVQQPGDYANPIPTTSATGPGGFSITVCKDKPARDESNEKARDWIMQNASKVGASAAVITEDSAILHL